MSVCKQNNIRNKRGPTKRHVPHPESPFHPKPSSPAPTPLIHAHAHIHSAVVGAKFVEEMREPKIVKTGHIDRKRKS
ncbi:hypothetical protein BOTBODRAFT_28789 [Botryobasidium botryosum FD-172 SS1]|uniref:Uncharacterized protein n=1 Tax=Botryobasidium botryosum (strain FD-172 SS1) TaxID=930990 RepID=A0A067MUM1_BOTB1|nr:hypothetical protein BOTBODRAFT_28789 [Botryobasidium botryosum FD-172 SS1]